MARKHVSITALVDQLRATEGGPITSERIANLLDGITLDEKTLRPYVAWSDDHYARHLIHRDKHFDIMTICWQPGQGTPVHTHNGQLGWAFTTQGALDCTEYAWLGCDRPENQNVAGLDCLAGGREVRLDALQQLTCTPGGAVNRVTKKLTIHSLGVPADCKERTVSLHIYSLPFDSCVVFDLSRGSCARKDLSFDSVPDGYVGPASA